MEVKRAKFVQKGAKIAQIRRTMREDGALWRAVVGSRGLRISIIRKEKEKEEGGTRKTVLITPCHT
eukprot:12420424-Karenia_brevis.AAC.1